MEAVIIFRVDPNCSVFGLGKGRAHEPWLRHTNSAADQEFAVELVRGRGRCEGQRLEDVALAGSVLADEDIDGSQIEAQVHDGLEVLDMDPVDVQRSLERGIYARSHLLG